MVYYCVHKQLKYLQMQSTILHKRGEGVIINKNFVKNNTKNVLFRCRKERIEYVKIKSGGKFKMALFGKESISGVLGKAKELAGKATEAAKTGIDQTKTMVNEKMEQSKQKKLPQEGGLIRYEVIYKGGHPDFQLGKKKSPYILLDIMPDRFSFLPDTQSENWFTGFEIPYNRVISLEIVERTISNAEMLLSSSNNNSDLRQKNVMEIKYLGDAGDEYVVRNEMLTGLTVMGQAKVCLEMLDLLRTKGIMKQFKGTESNHSNNASGGDDVLKQIEKLAVLKDSGIITEEEFNRKKAVLLEKL